MLNIESDLPPADVFDEAARWAREPDLDLDKLLADDYEDEGDGEDEYTRPVDELMTLARQTQEDEMQALQDEWSAIDKSIPEPEDIHVRGPAKKRKQGSGLRAKTKGDLLS